MGTAPKLQSIKEFRRARLAALLDKHGKTELSRLVDISADYLWQMGKGRGGSARGVSDANAAKIEAALGKPAGWMDGEESAPLSQSQPLLLDPVMLAETHRTLRELEEERGRTFFLEDESDAARFVQLYQERAALPKHPSQEDWVQFGRKLAVIAARG
ncbi:hypothetical protein [Frateuria terrea]|uniref:Uncharacterized protein n=1 Tax=Frateuria terrea TaxID=529704 RepID=A0A1H6ZPG2_9GAMM|nr:hypothetical protein [Frateuria terrea]SEJ55148.1 hypothetical protein SAMN04487997_0186 [Frateuria terrea]SFP47382.1 hypothetical protein SAMN02927913_2204 [Frateuria terrea]